MKKERLDILLVNRGLFESRAKAQAAVMAGQILVNEQKIDKIKQLKKEFFIIDTSNNPKENKYEEILKKEGLYE